MTRYLVSTFTLSMLELPPPGGQREYRMVVEGLTVEEFCREVGEIDVNAVGHQGTADMINAICGTSIAANRVEVRLRSGDELLLVQIVFRPPEGKVFSREEMLQLYREGKVRFFKVEVR